MATQKKELSRQQTRSLQRNAEAFAKSRAKEFTQMFLLDTDFGQQMFDHYLAKKDPSSPTIEQAKFNEVLVNDGQLLMGRAIAIAYACGYADSIQGNEVTSIITGIDKPAPITSIASLMNQKQGQVIGRDQLFPNSHGSLVSEHGVPLESQAPDDTPPAND